MSPRRAGQRRLVDPSERRLSFEQEALAQTLDALGVALSSFGHFSRGRSENLSHDEPTIERALEPLLRLS